MNSAAPKLQIPTPGQLWTEKQLDALNPCLERMGAIERVGWALEYLPGNPVDFAFSVHLAMSSPHGTPGLRTVP